MLILDRESATWPAALGSRSLCHLQRREQRRMGAQVPAPNSSACVPTTLQLCADWETIVKAKGE